VDHGDDEPLVVEVDGDAQVDAVVDDQRVLTHRGVEMGVLGQRLDRGQGGEREIGETEPLLRLEALTVGPPHQFDPLVVDLLDHQRVRGRGLRPGHVLGGTTPDVGERDDLVPHRGARPVCLVPLPVRDARYRGRVHRGRRSRWTAGGDQRFDVAAGDPPTEAGAGDRRRVDAVFVEQPADHR
jgi:hypothetical protein